MDLSRTTAKATPKKKFDYAVEIGVPVLVMLRDKREKLPADTTEQTEEGKNKLDGFVASASNRRVRKEWSSLDGLKLAVRESLDHAKATKKRPGWIRGDQSASTETLEKLLMLQAENEELKKYIADNAPLIAGTSDLADLETPIILSGSYTYTLGYQSLNESFAMETSLGEVFELISPHLLQPKQDSLMGPLMSKCLWLRRNTKSHNERDFEILDELFQTIKIQFMALNLVKVEPARTVGGGVDLFWNLAPLGSREMIRRRTLKSAE